MNDNSESSNHHTQPSHHTQHCPQWCVRTDHKNNDASDDQFHIGEEYRVAINPSVDVGNNPTPEGYPAEWLTLYLLQPVSEKHPRIWLGADDTAHGFHLALPEAQHVAALLYHLTELAALPRR